MGVGEAVADAAARVLVGEAIASEAVAVGESEPEAEPVALVVEDGVSVEVGEAEPVCVAESDAEAVAELLGVGDVVADPDSDEEVVAVAEGVEPCDSEAVGVTVLDGVLDGVRVGLGVGCDDLVAEGELLWERVEEGEGVEVLLPLLVLLVVLVAEGVLVGDFEEERVGVLLWLFVGVFDADAPKLWVVVWESVRDGVTVDEPVEVGEAVVDGV